MKYHDKRLVEHGERVAFICYCIYNNLQDKSSMDLNILIKLALFHDIGAYKTEEIDRMVQFESNDVFEHSIYGYLFFKYFTPLKEYSEVILNHHAGCSYLKKTNFKYMDYVNVIHLADRVDILLLTETDRNKIYSLLINGDFDKSMLDCLAKAYEKENITQILKNGDYFQIIIDKLREFPSPASVSVEYLKMLVFSIDFKSKFTVVHSVTTTQISVALGKLMNVDKNNLERLYIAALIHDIGKIAIDEVVLEKPAKLTNQEMQCMKEHVVFTKKIIENIMPDDITNMAVRHHEKLDGSGYPLGLSKNDLSVCDRIVAVADILCALTSKRSYKEVFTKEKTFDIINDMIEKGQIDKEIAEISMNHFEEIMQSVEEKTQPVFQIYNNMHKEYTEIMCKIKNKNQ